MNDFKVLLQAVLDSSGIGKSDIAEVQKVLNKYHLNLAADLNKAELIKTVKQIVPEIEAELKKITGIDIKINETDLLKAINQVEKNSLQAAKAEEKLVDTMERVRAKSEEARQAEEKRQQLAQNNAVNKSLEDEYNSKEKLVNQMADYREKSESAAKAEEKRTSLAQNNAINTALEKEYLAVEKINQAISSGTNEAKVEKLTASFRSLGLSTEETQKELSGVNAALKSLDSSSDNKSLVNNAEALKTEYAKVENQIKQLTAAQKGFASESQRLTSANSMTTWLENNSKASKLFGSNIKQMVETLRSADDLAVPELEKINIEFEKIKFSARDMGLLGRTIGDSFKDMGSKFVSWITVSGGIMTAISGFKKMKDSVVELNGAITDLAMATGASKKKLESYIETYSKLGDELSATVTDVTTSGTEWLKQGKSVAETETLIRDAMILSKDGKLSSADSTKYLTSAMKGYNVEVGNTLGIVDKLSAVDMASATDVGGLAEGMSEVASSADLAGISMDKLLGYLAVIGETTQDSMSSVGTSLNAIFSRMGNIKLSRLKDYQNNGSDLSNVETVLRGEGINLRDSQNSFRNFGDVLDEVAGKWNSFSEVSQHAVASAFAGTEHINDFLILMNQYPTALKYTETSLNSSGSAMEKFNAYQDSVSAHTAKLQNAFIGLSNSLIDSGTINFFLDFGTALTKTGTGIINFLTPLGLLGAGIGAIASNKLSTQGLDFHGNGLTQILHGSGKSYCYG